MKKNEISDKEYSRIHSWLKNYHGRAEVCEMKYCPKKSKRFDWALIKGKKYKCDRNSFMMLCRTCHMNYDWTEDKRKSMRKLFQGEKGMATKLREKDVLKIRSMYVPWKMTMQMIADKYGITAPTVSAIITRKSWRHI